MAQDYVPRGNDNFNSFQRDLAKQVVAQGSGWGIPNNAINDFKADSDLHNNAYQAIRNSSNRTQGQVHAHTASRKHFEPKLRLFVNEYLASNSKISVKEKTDMKLSLRLRKRHARPGINTSPELYLEPIPGARLRVLCREESSEGRCHIPKDTDAVEFAFSIGERPVDRDHAQKTIISRKARFTIALTHADIGKRLYGFARWRNLTSEGKSGPWISIPVMALII